jgi:hypothetical protein
MVTVTLPVAPVSAPGVVPPVAPPELEPLLPEPHPANKTARTLAQTSNHEKFFMEPSFPFRIFSFQRATHTCSARARNLYYVYHEISLKVKCKNEPVHKFKKPFAQNHPRAIVIIFFHGSHTDFPALAKKTDMPT